MTTIIWKITQLTSAPSEGQYSDVVLVAYWNCSGYDGDYKGFTDGLCSFPLPQGSFTPYADLTEDQVLGWCWSNGVSKDGIEALIQNQIDNQINPPLIVLPLPWEDPAPPEAIV